MYISDTLYHTPPTDARQPKEMACYALLDRLGVSYARIDHDAADTIALCHAIDDRLGALICKNLFLCNAAQTRFYLLLMPGDKVFKTKDLSHQIGSSRLSFAPPAQMLRCLDITPGSVSVFGLMNDHAREVTLLIDREVAEAEYIGCHPCVNTSSLRLRVGDLFAQVLPALGYTPIFVTL